MQNSSVKFKIVPKEYKSFKLFALRSSLKQGFTLFEMVISIGLFSVLIIAAASITIAVSNAQIKAQNIQGNLDNIRFSLELITKEMRTGTEWGLTSICASQGSEISFITSLNEKRVYFLDSTTGKIMRAKVPISGSDCTDTGKVKPFTADEVLIDRFSFSLTRGQLPGPADGQPRATITLRITSRSPKEQLQSSMDLQTTIVQRFRDL